MSKDESDNDDNILRAISASIRDCSETERAEIYSHIKKQEKSFEVINGIDTTGVEPLYEVDGGDGLRVEKIK
ncbi:MAG: hypothetical protein HDT28_09245 [Clostridiales bacterium]|nr:hypothetical protein [Clostridiales bacterium]